MIIECYLMEFIVSVQLKTYSIFRWIIAWREDFQHFNDVLQLCGFGNAGLSFQSHQEFLLTKFVGCI